MNDRDSVSTSPIAEPYSPQRRTALVLTGTGTSGAYHAGVLRALHEAGVKLDIVAGRGIGVVGALFAAVDGAQRLWDDKGFWRAAAVRSLYGWRLVPRVIAGAVGLSLSHVPTFSILTLPRPAIEMTSETICGSSLVALHMPATSGDTESGGTRGGGGTPSLAANASATSPIGDGSSSATLNTPVTGSVPAARIAATRSTTWIRLT